MFLFPCCIDQWRADVILRVPKTSVHGPRARVVQPLYMEPSERGMSPCLIHWNKTSWCQLSALLLDAPFRKWDRSEPLQDPPNHQGPRLETHPLSASFRNPSPKKHEACSNPPVHGYLSAGAHATLWISQRSQTSNGKPSAAFSCPPRRCKVLGVAQHVSRNPGKKAASRAWERRFWKAHLRLFGSPLVHGSKLPLIWTLVMTHASVDVCGCYAPSL